MSSQISLFDGQHKLKIDKPIHLIELFAGIGAQAKALERLGVQFEHYRICEFDKYAVTSYNAIHGTYFKTSDICKIKAEDLGVVDTDKCCYIMTYSFPCTDLSVAGKQAGMSKGTGTRSGLLWEVERLLREMKELPQILLMENVPQVIGQKNIKDFADWISFLDGLGYKSKWEVLNAKDFNVPQNRERCFMVSWQGDYYYEFPHGVGCKRRLKDILETEVDEKYYLSEKGIRYISSPKRHADTVILDKESDIAPTAITAKGNNNWTGNFISDIIIAGMIEGENYGMFEQSRRVYDTMGIAPTQNTCGGGQRETKIIEPTICAMRGRNPNNPSDRTAGCPTEQRLEIGGDLSNTLTSVQKDNLVAEPNYRIRKLTPRECFRLMDFEDEDFDKVKWAGISDSQAYKQAGNNIVVAVLEAIFKQML